MNWGRTIVSNKIWLGELPSSCSVDYLREKIRVSFTDTFNEVIYDPRHREALLLFSNNDSAQKAFSMIKTKQVYVLYSGIVEIYSLSLEQLRGLICQVKLHATRDSALKSSFQSFLE